MSQSTRLPVLLYHAIGGARDRRFERWAVAPALLEAQLEALSAARYRLLPLAEAMECATRGERVVALTFDDGYADLVETALPILARAGARATVYAPTAYVGRAAGWLSFPAERARPVLGWSELRALASNGFEIAPHGDRHLALDVLGITEARAEIQRSAAAIADQTGRETSSFAYPFGYHSARVRRMVAEAGIDLACEVGHGLHRVGTDPLRIRRLLVTPRMDCDRLLGVIEGPDRSVSSRVREALRPCWRGVRRARRVIRAEATT